MVILFGRTFCQVCRAGLFVCDVMEAKNPVRSNGEEWACLGIPGNVSRSPTVI